MEGNRSDVLNLTLPATGALVLGSEQWIGVTTPLVLGSPSSSVSLVRTVGEAGSDVGTGTADPTPGAGGLSPKGGCTAP
jgi:hypothetical protein